MQTLWWPFVLQHNPYISPASDLTKPKVIGEMVHWNISPNSKGRYTQNVFFLPTVTNKFARVRSLMVCLSKNQKWLLI